MTLVWHWPQITWAILSALQLWGAIALNGKPRTGNYDFQINVWSVTGGFLLLYFGGFFLGNSP
jgi:hypothetical protein